MVLFGNLTKFVFRVNIFFSSVVVVVEYEIFSKLQAQHINKNCPNRPFVFEKIPSYKLIDDKHGKEFTVQNKNECENKCLIERDFTCRSASFMSMTNKCYLSPSNRHVAPSDFKSDVQYEYLENMCLKSKCQYFH